MKAYVLHLFSVAGGGERVSLEIARLLKDKGFKIVYLANSSDALKKVANLLGLPGDYEVIEVDSLLEELLAHTGRFVRLRRLLLMERGLSILSSIKEEDALIVDTSTNYPLNVDVSYIHYPLTLPTIKSNSFYFKLYDRVVRAAARRSKGYPKIVLTNSTWTASILKKVFNLNASVIHPPVDVDYFSFDWRKKERAIVTISRLTPEKNLHLLPEVASKLGDYEWYLVGSLGTVKSELDVSMRIFRKIKQEVDKHGVKNFHVLLNLPRKELRELLLNSMFYVHPVFPEHFGISVAEAISAGCIPVVYKNGGSWTDIVMPISPGLGYETINDIVRIIRSLEENPSNMNRLMTRAVEHSRKFRAEVFRKRFIEELAKYGVID
ncbi:MAG: glycosyltransferase family 4 protein [Thermosphaera sp.]